MGMTVSGVLPFDAEVVGKSVVLTLVPRAGQPLLAHVVCGTAEQAVDCAGCYRRGDEVTVTADGAVAHGGGFLLLRNVSL